MEKSRTEYSLLNTTVSMGSRIIALIAGYISRIVFTYVLGQKYVGVNGLFLEILNILSLSELGVGTAITYALYKPVSMHDVEKQKTLVKLYQRFYQKIAITIFALGLAVIPFLDRLIKPEESVENIVFIYLIYLINSTVSYIGIYKKVLIDAHQRGYISALYHTSFLLLQYCLQITVLLLTGDFILYLLIHVACTIGHNVLISHKADQLFPYLRDKRVNPIEKQEKDNLIKNIKSILLHKVGSVAVNNTDNILLSAMIGIRTVACYSNYYLVIGSLKQILNQVFQGVTASVGNLGAVEDDKKVAKIFGTLFFVGYIIYGLSSIVLFEVVSEFVAISFGQDYVFDQEIVLILCLNFYLTGMRQPTIVFRDSLGLFWFDRYKSIVEALANLIFSVILAKYYGAIGIFLGTCISTIIVPLWIEPLVLYRHKLHQSVRTYFLWFGLYTIVFLLIGSINHIVCDMVRGGFFVRFIAKALISVTLPSILLWICYRRTYNYQYLKEKLVHVINRSVHGNNQNLN